MKVQDLFEGQAYKPTKAEFEKALDDLVKSGKHVISPDMLRAAAVRLTKKTVDGAAAGEFCDKYLEATSSNRYDPLSYGEKKEDKGFKFYTEDPYGHGLDPSPVEVGEMLPTEDGNDAEYVGITPDGKKVIVKINGKKKEVSEEFAGGKIVPASTKPGGKGWAKSSASDHFKKN